MDGIANEDKQKSRLSPDDELAKLEKKAQAIRDMLRAVEEEEVRLRSQMVHQTENPENENRESEQGKDSDKSSDTSQEEPSRENVGSIHGPDLLMDQVVDEDSLDRELKGLD